MKEPALPVFADYPKLAALPWRSLADLPTPVERLKELECAIGGPEIWIKRDDRTSDLYGGNKVRKNEFLIADAMRQGCDRLLTVGAIGSHHCCSVAAFGAREGLSVSLVHSPQPVTPHVREMLLRDASHGADFVLANGIVAQAGRTALELRRLRRHGERPYFIWPGGSTPVGTLGYVNAGLELCRQIDAGLLPLPSTIFVPAGSGGTAAGLAIAFRLREVPIRIAAVRIVPWPALSGTGVRRLARRTLARMARHDDRFGRLRIRAAEPWIEGAFLGRGYGWPTGAGQAARRLLADTEGIELEDTYTAKTFAALLEHARRAPSEGPLLFWNTYNSAPAPALPPHEVLPPGYHRFF